METIWKTSVCWLVIVVSCVSCTSVSDQSIRVVRDQVGQGVVIHAKSTVTSRFDPDGGSRKYRQTAKIHVFGQGRNMSYRNKSGTIYRFGQDFDVDVDSCSAGYLWVSDDRKKIGIALFDVDPPIGLSASEFNRVYALSEGAGL